MKVLAALLLMTTLAFGKEKQKTAHSAYMDGTLLTTKMVTTGDFTCTQEETTSHCEPDTERIFIVNLGEEILPVVPFHSKKGIALGLATMGRSEIIGKRPILWSLTDGEHFQYRIEGLNFRIKAHNQESVYTMYYRKNPDN